MKVIKIKNEYFTIDEIQHISKIERGYNQDNVYFTIYFKNAASFNVYYNLYEFNCTNINEFMIKIENIRTAIALEMNDNVQIKEIDAKINLKK